MNNKDIKLQEIYEKLPFWNDFNSEQKHIFEENSSIKSIPKNTELLSVDYNCAGLIYVSKGSLRVYILSDEGKEVTLYRVSQGEICVLSVSCAISAISFDVHISSIEDSEIIQVDSNTVKNIIDQNIKFELFAYKTAAERFSDVMWAMQQILFMSFDKRLAIFLLDESSKTGSDSIRITHEEIAKYLGSAREVVSRMLKYFSEENYVELSRGKIKIMDRKKLLSLTQG